MSSQAIRARVAPIALVIALAFVILGFFRADHEMTRAELDRATLMANETATLVEVFVLRQVARLQVEKRAISDYAQDSLWIADSLPGLAAHIPQLASRFDEVWITGANGRNQRTIELGRRQHLLDTTQVRRVVQAWTDSVPVVVSRTSTSQSLLLFVESTPGRPGGSIVGVVSADSLRAFLQRQKRPGTVGIVVSAGGEQIAAISPRTPNEPRRSFDQTVAIPTVHGWTVRMTYSPPGRAARITLWVVGLGAIVGLGVGLLLERREAIRIADRSSELEHLSTELLRANRAKSEFLANVSHELRTPLNAIVGFVDLLRDGVYGPLNSRQVGPVERIEASANHLRHLVDQVLDLAKMAAGRLEVHNEPVELRPFVFDVASEVEPLMTEKGLSLSLAVGASLPRVRTDPTHLRQILINLLGNAVKFTASGGIAVRGKMITRNAQADSVNGLTVGAVGDTAAGLSRLETHWIALQVTDSGIGIAEKDRERIFDEFEQVNAGPRGDSMRRGTGLGLSISRRLARLLGGDITVESELGRGSIFTLWLPVDVAEFQNPKAS